MIINAGIVRVVATADYHASDRSKDIFRQANIILEILNPETEEYPNQGKH